MGLGHVDETQRHSQGQVRYDTTPFSSAYRSVPPLPHTHAHAHLQGVYYPRHLQDLPLWLHWPEHEPLLPGITYLPSAYPYSLHCTLPLSQDRYFKRHSLNTLPDVSLKDVNRYTHTTLIGVLPASHTPVLLFMLLIVSFLQLEEGGV